MSVTVKAITSADLPAIQADVERVGNAASDTNMRLIMGRAIAQVLQGHFGELAADATHHRSAQQLGASPTGFYERAARGVQQPELESEGVSVSINAVGIRQRLFGGTIKPQTSKWLTIPARTEAYGKRAGEFVNLRFIKFRDDLAALVQRSATVLRGGARGARDVAGLAGHRRGEDIGGLLFYWLVKQVTQEPDPSVLPTDAEMVDPALANAREYLGRLWSRS